jgi:DNA-binding NtrC family response regulator
VSIEDLGSRNGTRVSGRAIAPNEAVLVAPGTPIEAGDAVIYVRAGAGESEDPLDRLLAGTANVVIRGERGAGKTYLAQLFHGAAPERTVVVDGGAMPDAVRGRIVAVDQAPPNAITVTVPPLRQRLAALPKLVDAVVARIAAENNVAAPLVSADALSAIAAHAWPGNMTELVQVLTRAVLLGGRVLTRTHLALDPQQKAAGAGEGSLSSAVEEAEHRRILEALRQADGNQTRAAKLLGISRGTLLSRLERYGVPRPRK